MTFLSWGIIILCTRITYLYVLIVNDIISDEILLNHVGYIDLYTYL